MVHILNSVLIFLPIWSFLHKIIVTKYKQSSEFSYTYISSFHAYLSIINSLLYLTNSITINNYLFWSGSSVAYVLFDLPKIIKDREMSMVLHHLIIFAGYSPALLSIKLFPNYYKYVSKLFLAEISTIFLNKSWFLYKLKLTNTQKFKKYSVLLLTTFFIFRVCNVTYIDYLLYLEGKEKYWKITIPFTFLNYYWFGKLLRKAINCSIL